MSSNIDLSLDDIISKNKTKTRGGAGGRGRGGRGRGRSSGRMGNAARGGRQQRGGSHGGFRSPRANINGKWSHDMYYGGAAAVARSVMTGPTKLNITNLDYGVSDTDIKELFSEFGNMRSAAVHYDRSGRSLGTAHVIFDRRSDGLKAIKHYNGVHLDGRPMNISIDGESTQPAVNGARRGGGGGGFASRGGARNVKRLQGGPRPIGGGARGRGGRGGSRGRSMRGRGRGGRASRGGGRGAKAKVPTAEELDAELDAYAFQAAASK